MHPGLIGIIFLTGTPPQRWQIINIFDSRDQIIQIDQLRNTTDVIQPRHVGNKTTNRITRDPGKWQTWTMKQNKNKNKIKIKIKICKITRPCLSLTNVYRVRYFMHGRVQVDNVRWSLPCMQVCVQSLPVNYSNDRAFLRWYKLAWTKVVLPEPAIPRHIMHVGLLANELASSSWLMLQAWIQLFIALQIERHYCTYPWKRKVSV